MTNETHVGILKQGAKVWNAWRKNHEDTRPYLIGADLSRTDLTGANLVDAILSGASLFEADLRGADLTEANLMDATLVDANLSGASLRKAQLFLADLSGADLTGANLMDANLMDANLNGAKLSSANLSRAKLMDANLSEANLCETGCRETKLYKANLMDANLSGADLYGANLCEANLSRADLSGADLRKAQLSMADLTKANLSEAGCREAILYKAILVDANLSGADMCEAQLSMADLSKANLSGTDLTGADLCRSYLALTNLCDARLRRATLFACIMVASDLSGADVEDALVAGFMPTNLVGIPKVPRRLVLDEDRGEYLEGDEAARFFQCLAVVQVVVSEAFGERENWGFRGVPVEMHELGIGLGVSLVRSFEQDGHTVLEFEGPSYGAIYQVLPELLQAFPSSEAIRFGELLPALFESAAREGNQADVERALEELKPKQLVWANQLATRIRTFCDTLALEISEPNTGRSFDVYGKFTNKEKAQQLIYISVGRLEKLAITGQGGLDMGDTYTNTGDGNVVAQGDGASINASEIAVNSYNGDVSGIDAVELVEELEALFQAMRAEIDEAEHLPDQTAVVEAKKAAEAGDLAGAMGRLKTMGKWGWDVVTKVGTGVALAAVKEMLGY